MKTPSLLLAAAMLCGTTPAFADCGFDRASVDIDLQPGAVAIDPYTTDPVTRSIQIPIDSDCGIVFFEFGAPAALRNAGETMPYTVRVENGSRVTGPGDAERWEIDADQTAIALALSVDTDAAGIPRSGEYSQSTTFRLYGGQTATTEIGSGATTGGSMAARVFARIDEVMTLSLNRIRPNYTLNLGTLTPGSRSTGEVTLRALSNDPYKITFKSAKDWNIVLQATEGTYEIPYTLDFAGREISADTTITDPGTPGGTEAEWPLIVTAYPPKKEDGDLRAGTYQDEVTIIITGISETE